MVFISGAGELFQKHCALVVKKTLNDKKKVDPNDLYDMMQLLLLRNENRLFVTDDKSQIPPDLVVKSQAIDIIKLIL